MKTDKKNKIQKASAKKSPISETRSIDPLVKLQLFVHAGGRCQFDGCNHYLLEHHVTLTPGNFSQIAHVVAFSEDGPRGKGKRPKNINNIANLMLLCPKCHKLIDDNPEKFTRETLEGYKKQHEQRIFHVTGLGPEQKTSVLILKSKIGKQTVAIPYDQILEAITPRYPISKDGLTIDLTQLPATDGSFISAACATIRQELQAFLGSSGEWKKSGHISLFGLAPIPVLMFLGSELSNKVPLDLYQRHRDKENWTWKHDGAPVQYSFDCLRSPANSTGVALIVALSGSIESANLPANIDGKFAVYRIGLTGLTPNVTFLRARQDLEKFREHYQLAVATIVRNHPGLREIHFFPAVSAPIAVLCGRELLPKVHPALRIYDFDKGNKGFSEKLTINN